MYELKRAAKACSVTDYVANIDAVTIFYSGGEDEIANALSSGNNSNIRVIRRTERFKLLSYKDELNNGHSFEEWVMKAIKDENPGIDKATSNSKFIQEMYGVSDAGTDVTEVGKGFWSQASADFAAETKGNSYALICNANEERIFSRDELKQLYNAIDDTKTINGYTKSELAKLGEDKMFDILKEKAINDFKNVDVYMDSNYINQ